MWRIWQELLQAKMSTEQQQSNSEGDGKVGGKGNRHRPHAHSSEVIGRWIASEPVAQQHPQFTHQQFPPQQPQQLYYEQPQPGYSHERNPLISQQEQQPQPQASYGSYVPQHPPPPAYNAPYPPPGAPYIYPPLGMNGGYPSQPPPGAMIGGYPGGDPSVAFKQGDRADGYGGPPEKSKSSKKKKSKKSSKSSSSAKQAPSPTDAASKEASPTYYQPISFGGEETEDAALLANVKKQAQGRVYGSGAGSGGSQMNKDHPLMRSPKESQRKTARLPAHPGSHRRVHSDVPRSSSKKDHPLHRTGHRPRLSSGGDKIGLPPAGPSIKGHHRRSSSRGSTFSDTLLKRGASFSSAVSMTSSMSVGSYVTDVTKSALFKNVTEEGKVQFFLPKDSIHIIMDKDLTPNKVYSETPPDQNERFLEYYLYASDANAYWENVGDGGENNAGGLHDMLPTKHYALTVKEDLYQRVFKEIADSQRMPCGLYFCGHHEEFGRPSVFIAALIVATLFLGMGYIAFSVE